MRLPFKVSTTTSNFMIGVTAAASAGVYLSRGYIDPGLSMPVMLGVLARIVCRHICAGKSARAAAAHGLQLGDRGPGRGNDRERNHAGGFRIERPARPARRDKRVDEIIGILLRTGVILAAAVVLVGRNFLSRAIRLIAAHYRVFQGEPSDLRHVSAIFRDALALHARGIIQLGLLLLIATPVARVIFTVFAFAYERDWTYVVITLIVLALLLYSLGAFYL